MRSRSGHQRRTWSASRSGERPGAGELPLEPRLRAAGAAYVLGERGVDAVAEARHQVTLRRAQQLCSVPIGHRGPPIPRRHHCPTTRRAAGAEPDIGLPRSGRWGRMARWTSASSTSPTPPPAARGTTCMERSARADRPHALLEAFDAFEVTATAAGTVRRRASGWQARDGDAARRRRRARAARSRRTSTSAWAEVDVLPEHRRRGVGRALWQAVVGPGAGGRSHPGRG